jgi:DNA-binding NarL/FixJ family response regulator
VELAVHADLMVAATWALVAIERLDDARAVARRSAVAVHRAGNLVVEVPLLLAEVLALGLLGRTDEAAVVADRAELVARLAHADQPLQWALWMRAWVQLDLGDLDIALLCARESVALARNLDESALLTIANTVLGSVLLALGQAAEAIPLLAAYDVEPGWICRWSTRLVEAQLVTGDRAGAEQTAARATALAEQSGLSGALAAAALSRALVSEGAEAAAHAEAAIGHATAIHADLDAATGHLIAGRALATIDRERALEHLSAAHQLAAAGGMQRTADAATRELRRLGRRVGRGGPRARAGTGVDALSTRERELADLVAAGLTNRQIAARLFLSEKTVESHLSKAFAKVGVNGRAALAAAVAATSEGR